MARRKPKQPPVAQGDMIAEGMMGDGFSDFSALMAAQPAELRKAKVYTLETVKRLRPLDYEAACAQLAAGMPGYKVAKAFGFSPHTIQAIKNEGLTVAQQKQRLGNTQMLVSEFAAEAALEDLMDPETRKKIPTVQKMMISGIGSQRGAENLSNGVSVTVNVAMPMSGEQFAELMGRAMGSGAETAAPKEAPGATVAGSEGSVCPGAPDVLRPCDAQGEAFDVDASASS